MVLYFHITVAGAANAAKRKTRSTALTVLKSIVI